MYYTIYKTTNQVNGKFYVGKHQTKNLNDNYLGSGIALKRAIKKYGKPSFTKEILVLCETKDEMELLERELINENWLKKNVDMTYNSGIGGQGGPLHKTLHTSETKKLMSEKAFNRAPHSAETNKKKARVGASNGRYGKPVSEETKENIRKGRKKYHWITNGEKDLYILVSQAIPLGFEKGRK